jgi:hypothetical protein
MLFQRQFTKLACDAPLLMNVSCLLASRYHPDVSIHTVQDIYVQVRRLAADVVMDPPPATSCAVHALALLCLFNPAVQTDKPLDSWHLSASTTNHAIVAFKAQQDQDNQSTIGQLRVLSGLCLTHLQ